MDKIKDAISGLKPSKHISKVEKTEINELIEQLDKIKYDKLIKELNNVVNATKYTKKLNERLNKLVEDLTENDNISREEACEKIEETIKEIQDDDLENNLDKECVRYNKFTKSNPAEYISYNEKQNNYRLIRPDNKEKKSSKLLKLIDIVKNEKCTKFEEKIVKFCTFKKVMYKNKKMIIYLTVDKIPYFDLNHVINLIDDKNKNDKYQQYKNEIKLYNITDNKYGGFYIKEFINQETFYGILLSSNSSFASNFKKEIAKILDQLTMRGQICITNDEIMLHEKKKPIEYLVDEYIYTQTYDNMNLVDFAKKRIKYFKDENWSRYLDKHVMYCFIITLDDPTEHNRILVKIGYSCDILDRIKSLGYEYKCKFFLIGIKIINNVKEEKEFHVLLKHKFSELFVPIKIGNHDKDEVYVFDTQLYKTFIEYQGINEIDDNQIKLEEESKIIMNDYLNNIEERFELELIKKLGQIVKVDKIMNDYQKETVIEMNRDHYKYLEEKDKHKYKLDELKETHRHIEVMKDKDIELRSIEYKILKMKK
jgi:hypothetical protein